MSSPEVRHVDPEAQKPPTEDDYAAARQRLQAMVAARDPLTCPVLTTEQQQIAEALKARCQSDFAALVAMLEAKDPAQRQALADAQAAKGAKADQELRAGIATGLSVAAAAANVVPVAGQIASAVLAVAAALTSMAQWAQVGPTGWMEARPWLRAIGSYRRFTPFGFAARNNWRPQGQLPDPKKWKEPDAGDRRAFMDYVDGKLAAYSALFGFDLRCVFPLWDTANPPSKERVGAMASRFVVTTEAFLWDDPFAGKVPGSDQILLAEPLYAIDDLPEPGSPAFEALSRQVKGP